MQITAITTLTITIEDDHDLELWRSLFGKLNAYANGAKSMNDVYKSTGSGYAKRIDFTDTERALTGEVALKLTTDEATN